MSDEEKNQDVGRGEAEGQRETDKPVEGRERTPDKNSD